MSTCPVHSVTWKFIPAGISTKTGNPYPAFSVCPVPGCRERPAKVNGGFLAAPQAQLEPRTGPSAPAPLPGASGGPAMAQAVEYQRPKTPGEVRQIVAQVAMKAAVELANPTTALEDLFSMSERIYLEIWRLSHIDPDEASQ